MDRKKGLIGAVMIGALWSAPAIASDNCIAVNLGDPLSRGDVVSSENCSRDAASSSEYSLFADLDAWLEAARLAGGSHWQKAIFLRTIYVRRNDNVSVDRRGTARFNALRLQIGDKGYDLRLLDQHTQRGECSRPRFGHDQARYGCEYVAAAAFEITPEIEAAMLASTDERFAFRAFFSTAEFVNGHLPSDEAASFFAERAFAD